VMVGVGGTKVNKGLENRGNVYKKNKGGHVGGWGTRGTRGFPHFLGNHGYSSEESLLESTPRNLAKLITFH